MAAALRERGIRPALVLDEGGRGRRRRDPRRRRADRDGRRRRARRHDARCSRRARLAGTPRRRPRSRRRRASRGRCGRLHRHPFPTRLAPPVRAMLSTVAPHAGQPLRRCCSNLAITGRLVAAVLSRLGPETNAIVRTTAVATQLSGAPGENVLATTARAAVNIRLLTGDTIAGAVERARRVIADPAVELEVRHASDPSPVSPWKGEAWQRIATAVTHLARAGRSSRRRICSSVRATAAGSRRSATTSTVSRRFT